MKVPGPIPNRGPVSGLLVTYSGLLKRFHRNKISEGPFKEILYSKKCKIKDFPIG